MLSRGVGLLATMLALASGCDDRPVVPKLPGACGLALQKMAILRTRKLDLLVVVNNSRSMTDKQAELARRIPGMIATLTDPTSDPVTGRSRHFLDVHVGVITASLGAYGTSACSDNDRGHLLPRPGEAIGGDCPAVVATPLTWSYGADAEHLARSSACTVAVAGTDGCAYQAPWEALYRFLIDPAPYRTATAMCTADSCEGPIIADGRDDELLAQRKAFLREDSMLAVIVLADQDDASLRPAGNNWLPMALPSGGMPRGWSGCGRVPDDFEPESEADLLRLHNEFHCFSCAERADNSDCSLPWSLGDDLDHKNLRAFHQTKRFGQNFLWNRQRYVDAFTSPYVTGAGGARAPNPLFTGYRSHDHVVVAAIVGAPPQLLPDERPRDDVWEKLVGPIGKRDPHMIASIAPRDGIPRFRGAREIDAVNGGDRLIEGADDLQYACIGLRTSTTPTEDCSDPTKDPLCNADGTQPYFKAYPGIRHLSIVKELGSAGLAASICNETYEPIMRAVANHVRSVADEQCLYWVPDESGSHTGLLLEALAEGSDEGKRCEEIAAGLCTPGAAPCHLEGTESPPLSIDAAAKQIKMWTRVTEPDGTARRVSTPAVSRDGNVYLIDEHERRRLVCEVRKLTGDDRRKCMEEPKPMTSVDGWCYAQGQQLVSAFCRARGATGTIRFTGTAEPRDGSDVLLYFDDYDRVPSECRQ